MNDPIYAAQQHEIAALCIENEKLKSRLTTYMADAETWHAQWVAEYESNAKLRELVRDLRFCARQSICLKCEHGRICDLRLDERCAELRIEVD